MVQIDKETLPEFLRDETRKFIGHYRHGQPYKYKGKKPVGIMSKFDREQHKLLHEEQKPVTIHLTRSQRIRAKRGEKVV